MNQAFSKIWIIIILIILTAGGIFAWQYWWVPKEEVKNETADIEFLRKSPLWINKFGTFEFGPLKVATGILEDGSYYGPPFDPELYQLDRSDDEFCQSNPWDGHCFHLFAKSRTVDLKKYLGKKIQVQYRAVEGVVMGEQQLVIVDRILKEIAGDETANWQIYRNEEYGFEMKYPAEFFPTQPLQPQTKAMQCDYANFATKCPFVSIEGFTGTEEEAMRFAETARTTINNMPFCLQKTREGAVGTTYVTYNYTTVRNNECFVVSFTAPYPNCQNYLPVESQEMQVAYDKCRLDNEVAKPAAIDKMTTTFKFLE